MERKQFTFYRSYYDAIKKLPKRERAAVILAICGYALDGEEPNLIGTASAIFTLIRPTLDAGLKKALGGSRGRPAKDTQKIAERYYEDTEKEIEKEVEIEKEKEVENECYPPTPFATVMSAYANKISPQPSEMCIGELKSFVEQMGAECCLRAIDTALDAGPSKANWPYIRGILRSKLNQGVRCLADWDKLEERREKNGSAEHPNPTTGNGGNGSKWNIKSALDDCD